MATEPLQRVLQGHWRLVRKIKSLAENSANSSMGSVSDGIASFLPVSGAPDDLLYTESGTVELPSSSALQFERKYLYTFTGPRSVEIRFYQPESDSGDHLKLFHSLQFGGDWKATADHLCIDDMYNVEFECSSATQLNTRWVVKGPSKDYEIMTTFFRHSCS